MKKVTILMASLLSLSLIIVRGQSATVNAVILPAGSAESPTAGNQPKAAGQGMLIRPAASGRRFVLQGSVPSGAVRAILMREINNRLETDSVEIKQGRFSFTGTIPEPVVATLTLKGPKGSDQAGLFLDSGITTLTAQGLLSQASIRGSRAQADYKALNKALKGLYTQQAEMSGQYPGLIARKDTAALAGFSRKMGALSAAMRQVKIAYVREHPASPIDIWVLNGFAAYYLEVAEVGPLYDRLAPELKATPSGREMGHRLETFRKTAVGRQAPEFTQPDTAGKMVSLSAYRGKYVLVDFWASWCHICRLENPYVLKAYNEYRDKGFDVLTVSLDSDKARWIKAFHEDGMRWTTVSDLTDANRNAVAKQYGVVGIPQSVLVDPNGKIVAKNLRGEALEKKLSEIFNK